MLWCRFELNNKTSFGIVEGDTVVTVDGSPFGEHKMTSQRQPLAAVRLLVPVIPGVFYATGSNYADHIIKMAKVLNREPKFRTKPDMGYRANNALIAHGEDIVKPKDSCDEFQYEGELVAVIGKKARNVRKEDAMDYVFGWTIGNDVSERGWQRTDLTNWRSKNSDTFKPMGPWIATGVHPKDMKTTVRRNGKVDVIFNTGNMLFDIGDFIAELTRNNTLFPGDVLWLGTDGLPENMKPGDVIEIEITGIGTLRNRVVAGQ
jgi:2-keto-4-pentenoate hydratase/2-oxohepta-3-ene-1,7-dioic acid hydratase in catechol pathway